MSHVADSAVCYNCQASLTGPYCAACGQKAQPLNPSAHDVLHDVTHEMLHVDGRIFRSVQRLLFSPGFLTREYVEGRRTRWIPPLRLYLIFSVIYFGVSLIGGEAFKFEMRGDTDRETVEALQKIGFSSEAELQEAVNHARATWGPRMMFLLVPAFAWFVHLVSRRLHRNFPQHLIFALHVQAAWFAAGSITAIVATIPLPIIGPAFGVLSLAYGLVYLMLSFRRAYGFSRRAALLRTAIVAPAYGVVVGVSIMAVVVGIIFRSVFWHRP
jgi:hypothetical protein